MDSPNTVGDSEDMIEGVLAPSYHLSPDAYLVVVLAVGCHLALSSHSSPLRKTQSHLVAPHTRALAAHP